MQDITVKQSYLYSQVIEGGYNAQTFQQFIVAQRPDKGMNLELWTLAQLKKVTIKFKNMIDNAEQPKKQEQITLQQKQSKQSAQSPPKKSPVFQLYNKNQEYNKVITCIKTQCKPLSQGTVITIDNFEKRQGGIFEKTYFVYQIKTNTLNSCVMRRYSDFQWLREVLEVMYPGLPIPPIANKGKMKRKDDKQLIKRMYILEKFLNKMLMIPDLRASQLLQKFLTVKEGSQIENLKSKYKKIKAIPTQKLQNYDGEIQLKIDDSTNAFISRTQKFMTVTQPQVKKLYKDFKGAATMLQGCANFLKSAGTSCQALSSCYNHYRKQNELTVNKTNLFSLLKQMSNRSAQLMQEQAKMFRKQMYSMLKYESFSMLNFSQSLQKLTQMQQAYSDHKLALCKRKQKLYEQGNISKWGATVKITTKPSKQQAFQIMLPKQTKQLFKQRENYALYNYQAYKQIQRNARQNDATLCKYFTQILQMQSNISSRSIMIWADLMIGVKDMNIPITA